MCIATFQPISHQIIFTHNRDEHIERPFSTEISTKEINGETIEYFEDEISKGTWAIHAKNFSAFLLNGERKYHKQEPHQTRSRGNILFKMASFSTLEEFQKIFNLTNYQPFTVLWLQHSLHKFQILIWDGKKLSLEDLDFQKPYIWLSSTLYNSEKKEEISSRFYSENRKNIHELKLWHIKNKMPLGEVHPKIKTVCITQIIIDLTAKTSKINIDLV